MGRGGGGKLLKFCYILRHGDATVLPEIFQGEEAVYSNESNMLLAVNGRGGERGRNINRLLFNPLFSSGACGDTHTHTHPRMLTGTPTYKTHVTHFLSLKYILHLLVLKTKIYTLRT